MIEDFNEQLHKVKDRISELVQKGYYNESMQLVRELEGLVSSDPGIYSMKSAIYYHLNDLVEAEKCAAIGLLLNPTHSDLLFNLAFILYRSGKDSQAKYILSIAIDYCQNSELTRDLYGFLEEIERKYQLSDAWGTKEDPDSFLILLLKEIYANLPNHYKFNVDIEYMDLVKNPIRNVETINVISERNSISMHIEGLTQLFNLLYDEYSKSLLLKVLSFRILGNQKVQLPLNNLDYWNQRKQIRTWVVSPDTLVTNFEHYRLEHYALDSVGLPIQMYNVAPGIHHIFVVKQYEYHYSTMHIKAQKNDIVIDCGGCWGDTALYFANEVGEQGRVYTMEFIPSNLNILHRNLDLNPTLKDRITVVPNPVWDQSDHYAYYIDRGGASLVSLEPFNNTKTRVQTLAIDDLVSQYGLESVDFIKMDIEGSEMKALKGAINTISKFRPTLAISLYHQISDFQNIPEFISQTCEDYIFTLNHSTILTFETILFAVPKEKLLSTDVKPIE